MGALLLQRLGELKSKSPLIAWCAARPHDRVELVNPKTHKPLKARFAANFSRNASRADC